MQKANTIYIAKCDCWNCVKCGKTIGLKNRKHTIQSVNPEPVEFEALYLITYVNDGWSLGKVEQELFDKCNDCKYVSKKFKSNVSKPNEFFNKEFIPKADIVMNNLKKDDKIDFVKFTNEEDYYHFLEEHELNLDDVDSDEDYQSESSSESDSCVGDQEYDILYSDDEEVIYGDS